MRRAVPIGILIAIATAGCGPTAATPSTQALPNAYGLTDWHTNLAATTCDEYTNAMTPHDQVAAAAWLLASMRRAEASDASDGRELAVQLTGGIMSACRVSYGSAPSTSVVAAATLAYTNDPSLHPPHR